MQSSKSSDLILIRKQDSDAEQEQNDNLAADQTDFDFDDIDEVGHTARDELTKNNEDADSQPLFNKCLVPEKVTNRNEAKFEMNYKDKSG